MKSAIALVSAALLLVAALARPGTAEPAAPRKPATAPRPAPEPSHASLKPSTLDVLEIPGRTWLPTTRDVVGAPPEVREDEDVLAVWRAVTREVARLLEKAYLGIYQERYDWTILSCEQILRIDRDYSVALEMLDLARRLSHMTVADPASIDRRIEPWVLRTSYEDEAVIPFSQTFRYPSREEWAGLMVAEEIAPPETFPTIRTIHRKLDTMIIDLDFQRTAYEDVLSFIRDFSGLNIILDASTVDRLVIFPPITVRVKGALRQVLRSVLAEVSPFWDFQVTEDRVVLITSALPGTPLIDEPTSLGSIPGATSVVGFAAVLDATRVDLDVQNWPLTAIIHDLRARTGLDIQLDHDPHVYVSFKASHESLTSVLPRLLKPRGMNHRVDGVTIRIHSTDRDPDRY